MKVTIDANVLFSCLIKDSVTRKAFFNPALDLYAPAFLLTELTKYISTIQRKSGLNIQEASLLIARMISQITFVNDDELKPYLPAAAALTKDSKDWLYLACALNENTIIWSNDKEFKKQKRVTIKTTKEMIEKEGSI